MRGLAVTAVCMAVAVVVAAVRLMQPTPLELLDLRVLDLRQTIRGRIQPGNEVVIVGIDEKSLDEGGRWPWPRSKLAELVDRLTAANAAVIGFDAFFDKPDASVDLKALLEAAAADPKRSARDLLAAQLGNDVRFADAIKASGRVVLAHFFEYGTGGGGIPPTELARIAEVSTRTRGGARLTAYRQPAAVHLSIGLLQSAAVGSGSVNNFPDPDGMYRRVPLVIPIGEDVNATAFSIEVLRRYLGGVPAMLDVAPDAIRFRLGDMPLPIDAGGEMWVSYLGPPRTFPSVSAADVLAGRFDPAAVAGKIAIVGFTATGLADEIPTPFARRAAGVELHATVIDDILRGRMLWQPAWVPLVEAGVIVLLGLLLGLALTPVRGLAGTAIAAVVAAGYLWVTQHLFVTRGLLLGAIYPLTGILFIYLGAVVFEAMTEGREKRKIRHAFRHYLNPEVTELVASDPKHLKLGGERREVTIFFSDIRGFTSVSEGLAPEALAELLNEYLGAMTDVIFKHEGLLDKYIGDAVMAFWGAPVHAPDHAARCVRAALDMQTALAHLHERWRVEGLPLLEIGMGIHTGDAVVGNFGSAQRFNYTVMGDAVNLASRLEGQTKTYATRMLVSESTRTQLGDEFVCREVDWLRVKGRKQPVAVYEVLGRRMDDRAGRVARLGSGFDAALAAYRAQDWDAALERLAALGREYPDDRAIPAFVERCHAQQAEAPGADWDGVYVAKTK
jgi:adenylate cyclase